MAVKVQRPHVVETVSVDLYIIRYILIARLLCHCLTNFHGVGRHFFARACPPAHATLPASEVPPNLISEFLKLI